MGPAGIVSQLSDRRPPCPIRLSRPRVDGNDVRVVRRAKILSSKIAMFFWIPLPSAAPAAAPEKGAE